MDKISKCAKRIVSNRLYVELEHAKKTIAEKFMENPQRTDVPMWMEVIGLYEELLEQVESMEIE